MKAAARALLAIFVILLCTGNYSFAAQPVPGSHWGDSLSVKKGAPGKTSNRALEKELGRKLTIKEKLALWVLRKYKKVDDEAVRRANSQALVGFLLSLAGLFLIPLLPSIAAIIMTSSVLKKEKLEPGTLTKNKDLAQIGLVFGIIGVVISVVVIILLLMLLSAWGRRR